MVRTLASAAGSNSAGRETSTHRGFARLDAISPSGSRRRRRLGPLHSRIPCSECGAEVVIQHLHPHLEQPMGPVLRPPHLVLLRHPRAYHLIDR